VHVHHHGSSSPGCIRQLLELSVGKGTLKRSAISRIVAMSTFLSWCVGFFAWPCLAGP